VRRRFLPFLLVLVAFHARAQEKGPAIRPMQEDEYDAFFNFYYENPRPERVVAALAYLGTHGTLEKESAIPPVIGFFTELFARNPEKAAEWKQAAEGQPEVVNTALSQALALSSDPKKFLALPPSSSSNDILWGAFFASGDQEYLTQVMRQLSHMAERKDLSLFLTGAPAKWSLASNAEDHPAVKAAIEKARAKATSRQRDELDDVLTKSPAQLQEEAVSILREEHAKGTW